jgi:hypothetical protein
MFITKALLLSVVSAAQVQTVKTETLQVFPTGSVGALLGNWVTNVLSALVQDLTSSRQELPEAAKLSVPD